MVSAFVCGEGGGGSVCKVECGCDGWFWVTVMVGLQGSRLEVLVECCAEFA